MSKLSIGPPRSSPPLPSSAGPAPPPPPKKRLSLGSGSDKQGAKKLTLKAKPRTSLPCPDPSQFLSQSLTTLARAVRAIQSRPPLPTPESLQALYTLCENVVSRSDAGQALYDRIRLEIERQAGEVRRELGKERDEIGGSGDAESGREEAWLKGLEKEWKGFEEQMLLIRAIFTHLDRTFVLHQSSLLSIWDLGLDIFRHSVIESDLISERISSSLLILIERERNGLPIPRPLISSILSLLSSLSLTPSSTSFNGTFNGTSNASTTTTTTTTTSTTSTTTPLSALFLLPFLSTTRTYFQQEAERLTNGPANGTSGLDSSGYLHWVQKRLKEEGERCDNVLGGGGAMEGVKGGVIRVVLEEMVGKFVEDIVEKDLKTMMDERKEDDLKSVYSLLSRVGTLPFLRTHFLAYLKSTGLTIVMDASSDDKMILRLIEYRKKVLEIVKDCFGNDSSFAQSTGSAFEFFVNKRENKPAEMMAKFLDAKLRSGKRGMDDTDLENTLNDVLYLFRFTQGKDIFEAFYKKDLAKRLLLNKSASFDAERSMLSKLKDECGPGFTQKLEIMFKDIELSTDVMKAYVGSLSSKDPFDLSVNVLSMGNWPTYPVVAPILPSAMSRSLDKFKAFYVAKHSGRSLKWQHSLDTCALKAVFPKGGRKELAVSLFQALVLLLFNEVPSGGKMSFADIVESTNIDKVEAARTLQSLACGKVRVLQKHPKGREVDPTDEFSFNTDFKDDHIKIKINQIQQKETAEENKSTTERVFTDRSSHLQLAIVRIMKARKTLKHSELVMEVVSQIGSRFKVETSEIKKSISSLIDREYLRRAEDAQNVYECASPSSPDPASTVAEEQQKLITLHAADLA